MSSKHNSHQRYVQQIMLPTMESLTKEATTLLTQSWEGQHIDRDNITFFVHCCNDMIRVLRHNIDSIKKRKYRALENAPIDTNPTEILEYYNTHLQKLYAQQSIIEIMLQSVIKVSETLSIQ